MLIHFMQRKSIHDYSRTYISSLHCLSTKVTKILIAPNKNFQYHLWSTSPPPKIDSSLNDLAQRKSIHSQTSYLLYIASYKSNKNSKIHLPKIFQILKEFKSSNCPKTKISNPIYDPSPPTSQKIDSSLNDSAHFAQRKYPQVGEHTLTRSLTGTHPSQPSFSLSKPP